MILKDKKIKRFVNTERAIELNKIKQFADTENEIELIAYFVSQVKTLIRKHGSIILDSLYVSKTREFPLLKCLLLLSHHEETMVKNSARIALLTIFKICDGKVRDYVTEIAFPELLDQVFIELNRTIAKMQTFPQQCKAFIRTVCHKYEEELEFIDDLMNLRYARCNIQVQEVLVSEVIVAKFLPAISTDKWNSKNSATSSKMSLFLIGKLLDTLTNTELLGSVVNIFIPSRFGYIQILKASLDAEQDISKIEQTRFQVVSIISNFLSHPTSEIQLLYVLWILSLIIKFLVSNQDKKRIALLYDAFLNFLVDNFIQMHCCRKGQSIKLKLLISILEPLVRESSGSSEWLRLRYYFSHSLRYLYLQLCQELKNKNSINLTRLLDTEYDRFLQKQKENIKFFHDPMFLIEKSELTLNNDLFKHNTEQRLEKLFSLRSLCLIMKQKREHILPLVRDQIKIGEILPIVNCISCEKLSHNNIYIGNHFLQFTPNQILILQKLSENNDGIVIFNLFYKDIIWTLSRNNRLSLSEVLKKSAFTIHLRFKNILHLSLLDSILNVAKDKQSKMLEEKINDLLELNCKYKDHISDSKLFISEPILRNHLYHNLFFEYKVLNVFPLEYSKYMKSELIKQKIKQIYRNKTVLKVFEFLKNYFNFRFFQKNYIWQKHDQENCCNIRILPLLFSTPNRISRINHDCILDMKDNKN